MFHCQLCILRVLPQGKVVNNLGPDRLAGTKALDPNYCRQPTLWLHDLCLEVLTVHGIVLRLFWAKAFPLLILLMSRIWHSSSRYNFYVFSYDAVWAENWTHHLRNAERIRYQLRHRHGFYLLTQPPIKPHCQLHGFSSLTFHHQPQPPLATQLFSSSSCTHPCSLDKVTVAATTNRANIREMFVLEEEIAH